MWLWMDLTSFYVTYRTPIWLLNVERIFLTHAGPEFVYEAGTIMIVRMDFYGLKYSGAAFYAHLAKTLNEFGSCLPSWTLICGTVLRLNLTALSTISISCVILMLYFVYLTTWELRSERYRLSSNLKETRWSIPKYILGIKS